MSTREETSFSGRIREALRTQKREKACCKRAYAYGESILDGAFSYIDRSYFKCPSCLAHFFAGVFVSHGSVNHPEKGHHLEIKTPGKEAADELAVFLAECGFEAHFSVRRGKTVLYFKDGDTIFGFLSFIGAQKEAFGYLDTMIERQVRNDCHRKINFDTANLRRTANASREQMKAIDFFLAGGKGEKLPEKLAETALLKKENPEAGLAELASLHTPPLSKSCVNHRLAKIKELYEKYSGKR